MNFYLGCAVWSYKDWVGDLYPAKSRPADFLHLYSRRFTTVEGNTTFYAVPTPETIQKWVSQTPLGFKFCPKMNRQITHQGLLVPRLGEAIAFLERMSGLGERLGTVFLQLPPSYSPKYRQDLKSFLIGCQEFGLPLALEVRHRDWFEPENRDRLHALLSQLNITRVLLDTRPIYQCPNNPQANSSRPKPQVPLEPIVTSNIALIRLISNPDPQYNQPHLAQWVDLVVNWLNQGKTVYFFVHCPQEVHSPATAKYFYSLLQAKLPNIAPLPWQQLSPQPTQLSLF